MLTPDSYVLGRNIKRVVDGKREASMMFADGSTDTADLVVGADGARFSRTRCRQCAEAERLCRLVASRGLAWPPGWPES
ncbi:hypothetical protein [Rhizobium sp. GN54]|uniref:hypothetical protein n=1 Tax=Rhizobium sp. GN54 TaxID=2898150 RepID=UPI001E3AE1D9|nr:hypothetical protein [Rhizobium sp. GN54]MCD2184726.1 hypothetical protein [Rhizobium sp. GN54]